MAKKKAQRKDLSGAFNARGAAGAAAKAGGARAAGAAALLKAGRGGRAPDAKLVSRLSNPFETRQNKAAKHDVLNRKLKGANRNVALSRGLAYEKRKRTLLTEFEQSKKANSFRDKRFGEKDANITEEERVLERFKRLRAKRNLYDLSDTDGAQANKRNKIELTHLGQSLSAVDEKDEDMEAFDRLMRENGLDEDEGDGDDRIDAKALMERIHAMNQSGEGATGERKSKKEVMEEVIAKAKIFKLQRQKEREDDENERDRLDDAFKGLMQQGLFHIRPTKKEVKAQELADMMARMEQGKLGDGASKSGDAEEAESDDEYDKTVRGLMFEARAAASDRTMTPEEAAKRELEKLEEKQQELERRMKGLVSDDEDSDAEDGKGKKKNKKKNKKDQDAFFDVAEADGESDDSDGESDDDEEGSDDQDESGSESDDSLADQLRREAKAARQAEKAKRSKRLDIDTRAELIKKAKGELPFVLDAPETHTALAELLRSHPEVDLEEVFNRIRKSNSIHLKAENKLKMRTFVEIVLEHLVVLVDQRVAGGLGPDGQAPTEAQIRACMTALYNTAQDIPGYTSQVFSARLDRMEATLTMQLGVAARSGTNGGGDYGSDVAELVKPGSLFKRKKGGHKGAKGRANVAAEQDEEDYEIDVLGGAVLASEARCWPSPGDLAFFRAVEAVFPVTDFRHPVVSPAQLLLGQYLAQCPVRGPRDAVAALCTSQLLLDFCRGAGRLAPEVVLALDGLATQAFDFGAKQAPSESKRVVLARMGRTSCGEMDGPAAQMQWLVAGVAQLRKKGKSGKTRKGKMGGSEPGLSLEFLKYDAEQDESLLVGPVLRSICALVSQVAQVFGPSASCDTLLEPLALALAKGVARLPGEQWVADCLATVTAAIDKTEAKRQPMRLLEVAAKPLRAIEPLYNDKYKWTKEGHDPDKQRAELKKLKKQVKREQKGVARELRKDAQFLSEQRQAEKQQRMDALRSQRRRNFEMLTQQAGNTDKAVREFGAKGAGSANVDMRGRRRK